MNIIDISGAENGFLSSFNRNGLQLLYRMSKVLFSGYRVCMLNNFFIFVTANNNSNENRVDR